MTDDQLAALILTGVGLFVATAYGLGLWVGKRHGLRVALHQAQAARAQRLERWTSPASQVAGEPGTPTRLLSDYEDAIYAEARHCAHAAYGTGNEQEHVEVAAQLHADVRRLRGRVFDLAGAAAPAPPPAWSER